MTRTAIRILFAIALGAGSAAVANAQAAAPGSGTTSVGTSGNATQISGANRENNSAYNQLVGAGDQIAKPTERPSRPGKAVPATPADIKAGAALRDIKGVPVGSIVSVDATQAIVATAQGQVGVPLVAFGKDDKGLLLGMTADKFIALVAQAHAKSQASN